VEIQVDVQLGEWLRHNCGSTFVCTAVHLAGREL